ncbi:hypothetical protein Avbf_09247 [Armadillidium vulgare]|nr:hypothetical protein Avbf_09247 [Armadillidium vulgare]
MERKVLSEHRHQEKSIHGLFTMFKNYKKKCCIPLKQHKTILSSLGLITPFIEEKFNLSKNNIESYEGLKDQKDYSCDNLYYNQKKQISIS